MWAPVQERWTFPVYLGLSPSRAIINLSNMEVNLVVLSFVHAMHPLELHSLSPSFQPTEEALVEGICCCWVCGDDWCGLRAVRQCSSSSDSDVPARQPHLWEKFMTTCWLSWTFSDFSFHFHLLTLPTPDINSLKHFSKTNPFLSPRRSVFMHVATIRKWVRF